MSTESQSDLGPIRLNIETGELLHAGRIVKLTLKATQVLLALAQHTGDVVSKQALFRTVWKGRVVGDAALASCIQELRDALQDEARQPRYIETLHRRGYRLLVSLIPVAGRSDTPVAALGVSRMVGRLAELAVLDNRLRDAVIGRRQVVFVIGEPGVGKTTLLDVFTEKHAASGEFAYAIGRCAEHYGPSEAYLPLFDAITRLCRGTHGGRVLHAFRQHAPSWLAQLPGLLGDSELEALRRRAVGGTHERMLRELADAITAISIDVPLILRLEDLQWSDASTLDWLSFLARHVEPARLLVVTSARPIEGWSDEQRLTRLLAELALVAHCAVLQLGGLSAAEVGDYLAAHFGAEPTCDSGPAALAKAIFARTEGNPLFMINVANDLVARRVLVERNGKWSLAGRLEDIAATIPEDLRRLIELQLERLSASDRDLLEAASAAGEEFSAATIAAALRRDTENIEAGCSELARRRLFLRSIDHEIWPDGTIASCYAFRHALYRATLYERLPAARRVRLHVAIGDRLESGFGDRARELAAELAAHFERGADVARAARYHQVAGDNAGARTAAREAIEHYRRALQLLAGLPDSQERTLSEITLNTALGPHLLASEGFGAPAAEQVYRRAEQLCDRIGATRELFTALWGLWLYIAAHGHLDDAKRIGLRLMEIATRYQERSLLLEAHHALWATSLERGELLACFEHASAGVQLYEIGEHAGLAARYGNHDAGGCCRWFHAIALALHGDFVAAHATSQAAIRLSEEIGHPFSHALALFFGAMVRQIMRETKVAEDLAERSVRLATEYGFTMVRAWASCISSWVMVVKGEHAAGIAGIHAALEAARRTGTKQLQPYFFAILSDACLLAGRTSEGLTAVLQGIEAARSTNERFYEAELLRLEGELARAGKAGMRRSVALFTRAAEIAREQAAHVLELRALTSLVRAGEGQPCQPELLRRIEGVLRQHTQHDCADVREASSELRKSQRNPREIP